MRDTHRDIHIDGPWFKDASGRTVILRGANVSGSSKIPSWPDVTDETLFYNHRDVSFVGRPFPLDEADEHFARLRRWGMTFLRLIVTWEAIEHDGPGIYDEAYLNYLYELVRKADQHGVKVFIDPHQDAWSRMSGGDGAPGWTYEMVGMDVTRFRPAGAANIHPFDWQPFVVYWLTNYTRLSAATMFTLFFGGNDFAPHTTVGDEPVQDYLQRHYINAFKQVAQRLKGLSNVVGFGTMNEPSTGFIGRKSFAENEELYMRRIGISPTPYQAMLLGSGYPQRVERWGIGPRGFQSYGKVVLNREGVNIWHPGTSCIWRHHGVWDVDSEDNPRLLKPHYFTHLLRDGHLHRVDFGRDYLRPFVNTFAREIRTIQPDTLMFVENVPRLDMPVWGETDAPDVVNASHWYDVFTLFTRIFLPFLNLDIKSGKIIVGRKDVQRLFFEQLNEIKQSSIERMRGVPTLLGEFGTSFNMPFKLNYRLNWFGMQERALDASYQALDANLLNGTLWNYTPDNTNHHGDRWNTEDLSIFSLDQQHRNNGKGKDGGGRALRAVVRPYACRTAGEPLRMEFDMHTGSFLYHFRHDPIVPTPTEIFIPSLHYPDGYEVEVSDGTVEMDFEDQLLRYWHTAEHIVHTIQVRKSTETSEHRRTRSTPLSLSEAEHVTHTEQNVSLRSV